MRSAIWLALVFLVPLPAMAQTLHVSHAALESEGTMLGELAGASVTIARWQSETRPVLRYRDPTLEMTPTIDLTNERTFLSAGVGRELEVQTTSAFRIDMRARTWAPVWGRARGGLRIALPDGFPTRTGILPGGAPMPANADRPGSAFSHAAPPADLQESCGDFRVLARPTRSAESWAVEGDLNPYQLGSRRGRFQQIRMFLHGFVVHGWVEHTPPECGSVGLGLSGTGAGCGDGAGRGLIVTLPAGTELFATETATTPFGRLRANTLGLEVLESEPAQSCSGDVCQRVPAEPSGTARWLLHRHGSRNSGAWVIQAWVRTPAEQLDRPAGASRGFGLCDGPIDDWPQR